MSRDVKQQKRVRSYQELTSGSVDGTHQGRENKLNACQEKSERSTEHVRNEQARCGGVSAKVRAHGE